MALVSAIGASAILNNRDHYPYRQFFILQLAEIPFQ